MGLPVVNALWVGSEMGPIHAACLASFVRTGHKVILHAYETVKDAPSGLELADARELMPGAELEVYQRAGRLALASDLIRYEILRRGLGLYIDCDVYCYRPMADAEYIFGWEGKLINGAVLNLPSESAVLKSLLSIRETPGYLAPWAGPKRSAYYRLRAAIGRRVPLTEMPYAWSGPEAVTWYVREHGLTEHAKPADIFYPVSGGNMELFFDHELSLEDITTHRTRYIHVYHRKTNRIIHPASPVGRMIGAYQP